MDEEMRNALEILRQCGGDDLADRIETTHGEPVDVINELDALVAESQQTETQEVQDAMARLRQFFSLPKLEPESRPVAHEYRARFFLTEDICTKCGAPIEIMLRGVYDDPFEARNAAMSIACWIHDAFEFEIYVEDETGEVVMG